MSTSNIPLEEKIEILPVSLLDQHRQTVQQLKQLAHVLRIPIGWHYLLDIVWIISHLSLIEGISGKRILDAGAGIGLIQWYLAQEGAVVWSVDRASRAYLPLRFRARYQVEGLRGEDIATPSAVLVEDLRSPASFISKVKTIGLDLWGLFQMAKRPVAPGKIIVYNTNLANLREIPSCSLNAVVSVSALEHNPPEDLPLVIDELMRVLKPGGMLLATLCAARDRDWFHEPSRGWCYTESSLRQLFGLISDASSNFNKYDEYFAALMDCEELRDNLAEFYYRSGNNGMPWGVWDPKYQPVGVCKIKR
jgi:SAM-dependent methyltransferase